MMVEKEGSIMAGESKTTTGHETIRRWAEQRGGRPARVKGTGNKNDVGVLRIKFTDDPDLEEISWDEFFREFDKRKLTFLYQDKTADGKESRFFKFIRRDEK